MSFTNSEQTPEWELGDVIRIDLDDDDDEAEVVVEVDGDDDGEDAAD